MLFFNPAESYRVSHPVAGGDASLNLVVDESLLRELAPRSLARDGSALAFCRQRRRVIRARRSLRCCVTRETRPSDRESRHSNR